MVLSKKQIRRFILLKQGLIGEYKFSDKEGILQFIKQAGCIQYDPNDVCGKNAELVLQSRVEGFKKDMLRELLYSDRKIIDYFDKNLSIIATEDWKYFERIRNANRQGGRSFDEINKISEMINAYIEENGPMCSKDFTLMDLDMNRKVSWYWSNTKLSRAALETLYFRGELIIHHKKGAVKYYALAKDCIQKEILEEKDPFPNEIDHIKWRMLRRISAVGLMWNKPSDAWLYIWNLKSAERNKIFSELLNEDKIIEIQAEDSKYKFYCLSEDKDILDKVDIKAKERTELIAPLDNMMWDRKLIKELFDFEYKWEIYTPVKDRKYGYYVLPILHGDKFIGRTEAVYDKKNKTLVVKAVWFGNNIDLNDELREDIKQCFSRFMLFNNSEKIIYLNKF